MTVIEAGSANYQGTGTVSTLGKPAQNIKRYPPATSLWLDDINVLLFETPEEKQAFLARLSLLSKVPVDQLTFMDVLAHTTPAPSGTSVVVGNALVSEFRIGASQLNGTDKFNDTEYFGKQLPKFPPGSGTYLNSVFDTKSTGLAQSLGLGGLKGAARALYKANYPHGLRRGQISNSDLNPETLKLLQQMFGQDDGFDIGHLNVLKMMGLVSGLATQSPKTWVPSSNGKALWDCFDTPDELAAANTFIPSMNLLALQPDLQTLAAGIKNYFSGSAYATGFTSKEVENAAAAILEGMGLDRTALPAGLTIPEDAKKALNFLFGRPEGNTEFTTAQLNTAIAMGLVTYNASSKTITLTDNGNTYLKDKEKPPVTTTNPPVNTDPLAGLTGQQRLARGFQIFARDDHTWFDVFDVGAGGYRDDDDYKISLRDIEWLSGMSGPDDRGWSGKVDTAWEQLPKEQRQSVINLAKYLMKHITENPDAWKELAGNDNTFSLDEVIQFCRTHNPGRLEGDPSGTYIW